VLAARGEDRREAPRPPPALSIVGSERLPASGYLRAKGGSGKKLIKASPIPYTIVRATQFFEFVGRIADEATSGQTVRLPSVVVFSPSSRTTLAANLAKIVVAKTAEWNH